ncbi:MAG: hypothetical protein WDO73_03740 [Ignavibacteriota bacterium]
MLRRVRKFLRTSKGLLLMILALLTAVAAPAAVILGPSDGIELPQRTGVDGLIVTPDLQRYTTRGLRNAA